MAKQSKPEIKVPEEKEKDKKNAPGGCDVAPRVRGQKGAAS